MIAQVGQSVQNGPFLKGGCITSPWGFSHDGTCEKLPTAKILLQDNFYLLVGSRTTIPSRVLRMDGWVAHLAFQLSQATRQVRSAGSGGATEESELKWTLPWMCPNMILCLRRPWNEAVALGP